MRTSLFISVLAILLISSPLRSEAQLLNRLKNKAKETAQKKAEEKIAEELQEKANKMVEMSWKNVFGETEKGEGNTRSLPFSMNSNVTTEDTYRFDTVTTMEIVSTGNDGKSDPPVLLEMHFNKDDAYTGTKIHSEEMKKEEGELFIVYDFKNEAMIMLMDSEGDKFSFAYDWAYKQQSEAGETDVVEEEIDWSEIEEWKGYSKIGSRTIAGFDCDGYRSETDQYVTEIWVTREADFGMESFNAQTNAKQLTGKIPSHYPYGMLMEMVTVDIESGDKTTMKVTDVKRNADIIYSMSDYPTMSMGKSGS